MALNINIHDYTFTLDPSGAIFWGELSILLIADVHLGKTAHFRKYGAAIPPEVGFKNFEKLTQTVNFYNPKTVIFLGDLFHSKQNKSWDDFMAWVNYTPSTIELISGNHDIIPNYLFEESGIVVHKEKNINGFLCTHHPQETTKNFNFCGHIHPGVKLQGRGKQLLALSCFYKTKNQLILPAFGAFTGKHILKPKPQDEVYGIIEEEVLKL